MLGLHRATFLFMVAVFVVANAEMQMCGDAVIKLSVQRESFPVL